MTRTVWFWCIFIMLCFCMKIYGEDQRLYMATERPAITMLHPKYFKFANISSVRYGRSNPIYYVDIHFTNLEALDNKFVVTFWFYEYYSSEYRRSFLELSYHWCNLIYKDQFFGPAMRKNLPASCPHKPGDYHLRNMTARLEAIPNFPFTKGRIYSNTTLKHEVVLSGYIDIELKRLKKRLG